MNDRHLGHFGVVPESETEQYWLKRVHRVQPLTALAVRRPQHAALE